MTVVVVGDAFLDRDVNGRADRLCPDAPVPVVDDAEVATRPGGAGLAALCARRSGADVVLVGAFAADAAGDELRARLEEEGVACRNATPAAATAQKIRIRSGGHALARVDLDTGAAELAPLHPNARSELRDVLGAAVAVLVSDYGRGITGHPDVRALLADAAGERPCVWDPHPRGATPVHDMKVLTPNAAELGCLTGGSVETLAALAAPARDLAVRHRAGATAVTVGARGVLLVPGHGAPTVVPVDPVEGRDTCGAGDSFASAVTVALARGALVSEAVEVAASAARDFVAGGGAAAVAGGRPHVDASPSHDRDAVGVAARVRGAGGTVVAAGGCFDLLHPGHVATLQAARRLGDCLVVLVNGDASVRRLKGPGRPVQPVGDRVAVLRALECVDAVLVFDEDTPAAALRRIRPHLFVKGGDYALQDLPEQGVLHAWDGEVVLLPYLSGRSTTRLVTEVVRRGA